MTTKLAGPGHAFRGVFRDDLAARAVYAEAAGIGRVMPHAVAVPESADDVVALVRWARAANVASRAARVGQQHARRRHRPRRDRRSEPARRDRCSRVANAADRRRPGRDPEHVDARARSVGLRFPVDPVERRVLLDRRHGLDQRGGCSNAAVRINAPLGPRARLCVRRWITGLTRAAVKRARVAAVDRFLADVAPAIRAARDSRRHAAASQELVRLCVGGLREIR